MQKQKRCDLVGALASGLCLIHCLATPLIFIAQSCTAVCCRTSPEWWKWIDYFFLVISFAAVYRSNQITGKPWVGKALWISWVAMLLVILNERISLLPLPEFVLYAPALALIVLHVYNQKHHRRDENCIHDA
ncbi:MAG: MerC domain-containing protein [Bacteroidia bacterium]|nr:MerC domain-containing protein [Bacteroidia bacterium]